MRVLVTGGTGFVGSHSAVELVREGCEVRLLVRDPAKVERVFAPWVPSGFVSQKVIVVPRRGLPASTFKLPGGLMPQP